MNSFNQYTQYTSGNGLPTTKTYDCLGMLRGITTGTIQSLGYSFDKETGNLIMRKDNRRNLTEIFSYDNLGRLTEVSGTEPLTMNFAKNGNITGKTSVGDYAYGTKPHAVSGVENTDGLIPVTDQRITYTVFNKVDSIIQNNYKYDLQYGYRDQRTVSKLMNGSGVVQKTKYYIGPYEKEIEGGTTREFYYIYGGDGLAAILKRQSGTDTMYYVHKDHLGSFDKITNSNGNVVDSASFDAWGRRRNPTSWTYDNIPATKFSRGYTGHEHLEQFGFINMNGRMYDPLVGMFLSVDPFVANPFSSQDFNRYSYCLNNPMKYTDPSGLYANLLKDLYLDLFIKPNDANINDISSACIDIHGNIVGAIDDGDHNIYLARNQNDIDDYNSGRKSNLDVAGWMADPATFVGQIGTNIFSYEGTMRLAGHGGGYISTNKGLYVVLAEVTFAAKNGGGTNHANIGTIPISIAVSAALREFGGAALVAVSRATFALSFITLSGDTRIPGVVNPNVEGLTTSRDTPFTPNITPPNNKNYFNDGPGVPDWLKWITWLSGGWTVGNELYKNWPKPEPVAPMTTDKTPEIGPKR